MRNAGAQPLAFRRAPVLARHIGRGPGLVDEDDHSANRRWSPLAQRRGLELFLDVDGVPNHRSPLAQLRAFGAQPWRLGSHDYAAYANKSTGQLLLGTLVAASWDASLAPTMRVRGAAIPEEAVAATLLQDLEA